MSTTTFKLKQMKEYLHPITVVDSRGNDEMRITELTLNEKVGEDTKVTFNVIINNQWSFDGETLKYRDATIENLVGHNADLDVFLTEMHNYDFTEITLTIKLLPDELWYEEVV